jgi:tetratricopeptide (TPR) repeat protein
VWWFFLQPRAANGAVPPSSVPPPPAAARARVAGADGTIPTPLGSTSRQAAQPQRPAAKGAAGVPPAPPVAPPAAPQGAAAQPAAGADVAGDRNVVPPVGAAPRSLPSVAPPAGAAPQAAPPTAPATPAPVKPSSPEEIQREAARHLAEGKRLMSRGEWEPARGEFAAVLALDPMSLESKELLDQMQSKVDQDGRVRKDLDEARRAFEDKDYQGALWKLYRLPADPRLGNNELRIRNAWFNWAIVGLKGGDAVDAKQKLTEVLQADPDDAAAKKLMEVAERYAARAKDRYFYSVVDTLRFRTFDQK